jgi:hypothetical protein
MIGRLLGVGLRTALWSGLIGFVSASFAHATVYGWKGEKGLLHLSNDIENVPEAQRDSVTKFTSKLAGKPAAEAASGVPPPTPEPATPEPVNAYERGLEQGLQTAERQMVLASEMARNLLAAIPPAPPTRIIIQQPAQPIMRYVDSGPYASPFYGFIGPYAPYHWGFPYGASYAYGFGRGRFVPHSHFFPGTRGRRRGLFFPHGHFSHRGFLFGHGFVVR